MDMSALNITMKYALFASLATLINLVTQELSVQVYQGLYFIYVSILAGTLSGLISKYWFDKRFIFTFQTKSAAEDFHKFILYSLTGVFTTILFWGFELGFHYLWGTRVARYGGAVIGLTLGYVVKYQLDKRYVFKSPSTAG